MAIRDIQARLDNKVEAKAKEDFRAAVKQARKILSPFFEPIKFSDYRTDGELEAMAKAFADTTRISKYGDLYLAEGMEVPGCYVRMKQAEASKEFIDKVDALQDQIDELYSEVHD